MADLISLKSRVVVQDPQLSVRRESECQGSIYNPFDMLYSATNKFSQLIGELMNVPFTGLRTNDIFFKDSVSLLELEGRLDGDISTLFMKMKLNLKFSETDLGQQLSL